MKQRLGYRVKKRTRSLLRLREPYNKPRQEPNRLKAGTLRWLLFDRWGAVRWAGPGESREGVQPGEIVHYSLNDWSGAIYRTYPRLWTWFYRASTRTWKDCGCNHRFWSRRGLAVNPSCERHGFPATHPDIWAMVQECRAAKSEES